WHPGEWRVDPAVLAGADALISLGGASVGHLPWTASYQRELLDSRIEVTRTLADAEIGLGAQAPGRWVSASAVGWYGSQPGAVLDERGTAGDTFLARLCVAWEAEAQRGSDA